MSDQSTPPNEEAVLHHATEPSALGQTLREKILSSSDIVKEIVAIGDPWNVTVEVRTMAADERAIIMGHMAGIDEVENTGAIMAIIYPEAVAACTFDPATGEKVFTEADVEDLKKKNGQMVEQIALVALRLSGLWTSAEDAAAGGGPADTLGKGSTPSPG